MEKQNQKNYFEGKVSKNNYGQMMVNDDFKQLVIVRQSQLDRTIDMFKMMDIQPTKLSEVVSLHQILVDLVMTGEYDKKRCIDFDDYWNKQKNKKQQNGQQ